MATKRLQDIPIVPNRIAINRGDPRDGEGPFVSRVSTRNAEQVNPNGLAWDGDHMGIVDYEPSTSPYPETDKRWQGNRADMVSLGGNKTVNYPAPPGKTSSRGNRSGE
jgi:hypothetical protein